VTPFIPRSCRVSPSRAIGAKQAGVTVAPLLIAAFLASAIGCGTSPPAAPTVPAAPNPVAPAPAPGASLNLSGAWTGVGTDAQGPEKFRWTLTQTDSAVAGTAILEPADPTDGTCGSCHKQKSGIITGRISENALTLTLDFPRGGNDLTPLCGLTLTATATELAAGRIAALYTGSTTCEGPITDGMLVVSR
jgi:hypothetical protein